MDNLSTLVNKENENSKLVQRKLTKYFNNSADLIRKPLITLCNVHSQNALLKSKPKSTHKIVKKRTLTSFFKSVKPVHNSSPKSAFIYKPSHKKLHIPSFLSQKTLFPSFSSPLTSKTPFGSSFSASASPKIVFPSLKNTIPCAKKSPIKSALLQAQRVKALIKALHCELVGTNPFPVLSCEVLVSILRGETRCFCFNHVVVVDCRYEYEFKGGHIQNATNVPSEKALAAFYGHCKAAVDPQNTLLVFHCEFSSRRAPALAKSFRQLDREEQKYPLLRFPLLTVLRGGYREFFAATEARGGAEGLCTPRAYVSMFNAGAKKKSENGIKQKAIDTCWAKGA